MAVCPSNSSPNTFPNMSGCEGADEVLEKELIEAGIEVHKLPFDVPNSEVPTRVIGSIAGWEFERAWYYWRAKGPGIPTEDATELHEELGKEIRVNGHCGCPSPKEQFGNFGVGSYHIDTQRGLNTLAALLRKIESR